MNEVPDLSVLKRRSAESKSTKSPAGTVSLGSSGHVPLPKYRWTTRVVIPGVILASAVGILA